MLSRKWKGFIKVLILGLVLASLSSCLFSAIIKAENRKKVLVDNNYVSKKEFASPKENTLVFFMFEEPQSFLSKPDIDAFFLQIDPKQKATTMSPARFPSGLAFFAPMPVGMDMHIYKYVRTVQGYQQTTIYYNYIPLGATADMTMRFKTKKIGLQYAGEYLITNDNFEYKSSKNELLALNLLKEQLKGSEWEAVIDKRIEELEK